jgi:hypothetical protein
MVNSTYVCDIKLATGETVEIRRLMDGTLVGLDGAYLEAMADDEQPNNPYGEGKFNVPDSEMEFAKKTRTIIQPPFSITNEW